MFPCAQHSTNPASKIIIFLSKIFFYVFNSQIFFRKIVVQQKSSNFQFRRSLVWKFRQFRISSWTLVAGAWTNGLKPNLPKMVNFWVFQQPPMLLLQNLRRAARVPAAWAHLKRLILPPTGSSLLRPQARTHFIRLSKRRILTSNSNFVTVTQLV